MPPYHFKLVDSHIVSDHGVHSLTDETAAQIEALRVGAERPCGSMLKSRDFVPVPGECPVQQASASR
jgi:hypothetical protein